MNTSPDKSVSSAAKKVSKLTGSDSGAPSRNAAEAAHTNGGASPVGKWFGALFSSPNALPIAVGAFALGATAGVLGAMLFPKLQHSQLVKSLGGGLGSAKKAIGDGLSRATGAISDGIGAREPHALNGGLATTTEHS